MGGARQRSKFRRPIAPRDPLSALRTIRLLFEGWCFAFGTALATRFVLPELFGESILFEEATRIMEFTALVLGVVFVLILTATVARVLWRM